MTKTSRQSFQSFDNIAQKNRSRSCSCGRLTLRLRTTSCWRRARISVASATRGKIRQRISRRKAEKRSINHRKIIESERVVRHGRMMEPPAKCKYCNGGRNIREGHPENLEIRFLVIPHFPAAGSNSELINWLGVALNSPRTLPSGSVAASLPEKLSAMVNCGDPVRLQDSVAGSKISTIGVGCPKVKPSRKRTFPLRRLIEEDLEFPFIFDGKVICFNAPDSGSRIYA